VGGRVYKKFNYHLPKNIRGCLMVYLIYTIRNLLHQEAFSSRANLSHLFLQFLNFGKKGKKSKISCLGSRFN